MMKSSRPLLKVLVLSFFILMISGYVVSRTGLVGIIKRQGSAQVKAEPNPLTGEQENLSRAAESITKVQGQKSGEEAPVEDLNSGAKEKASKAPDTLKTFSGITFRNSLPNQEYPAINKTFMKKPEWTKGTESDSLIKKNAESPEVNRILNFMAGSKYSIVWDDKNSDKLLNVIFGIYDSGSSVTDTNLYHVDSLQTGW